MDTRTAIRPPGAEYLLAEIAMTHGSDPWGTNIGWFFAIAHVLFHCTAEEIPAAWQYRHGDGCALTAYDFARAPSDESWDSYEESNIMSLFPGLAYSYTEPVPVGVDIEYGSDALLYVGTIVERYDAWCRLAGVNY
jgi:hypothetical protein